MLTIFNFTYTVKILFEKFEKPFHLHYLFQTKLSNTAKCPALKPTPSDQTPANASLLESTTNPVFPPLYSLMILTSASLMLSSALLLI